MDRYVIELSARDTVSTQVVVQYVFADTLHTAVSVCLVAALPFLLSLLSILS